MILTQSDIMHPLATLNANPKLKNSLIQITIHLSSKLLYTISDDDLIILRWLNNYFVVINFVFSKGKIL
jgi:hypothetical protein